MTTLRNVIESLKDDGGAYRTEAPEAWSQGRTLYGGITAALCAQAVMRAAPDLAPLRAAQLAFVGPAAGTIRLEPKILRRGRSSTFVGVDCIAEAGLAARALFVHGGDRPSEVTHDFARIRDVPPPGDCAPFFDDRARPTFFQNFEMQLAAGSRPLSRAEHPTFDVWVRHRDATGVDPVIALLALADSLPPAALTSVGTMGAISTMTWSIDLFQPVTAQDWHLLRSSSEQAGHGYSLQSMSLWDNDGRRLAVGRQTVALFI